MLAKHLIRLADRFAREKQVISRPGDGPFMTRWTLLGARYGTVGSRAVFLHQFHRSDNDHLHCHPWDFVSVILSGGYFEYTPLNPADPAGPTRRRWYGPGRVLQRPAEWKHRVELKDGREAVTLVFRGVKKRTWFFYCPSGATPWREYIDRLESRLNPCG